MKARFDADGEVVVITGGANGIGAGLAQAIRDAGGTPVIFDITTPADLDPQIPFMAVDVTDRAAVHDAVAEVVDRHGAVTALVAAAAIQPRVAVADTSQAQWHQVIGTNLDGVMWCCQAVLPSMRRHRRGAIVLFTSGLARVGHAEAAAYAATKGAMIPFAKSLAAEVAADRIRVNVLAPGVIDTPQFQAANPTGGQREHWAATTGIGTPQDVVGPLMFLLSDAASMTGSTLSRDRSYPKE
ncbi:MAG: SDR family NAD(P)-dependent oxidoreductase [Beutenbergiaceae bacterium]